MRGREKMPMNWREPLMEMLHFIHQYIDAKYPWGQDEVSRLCSDNIPCLKEHLVSIAKTEAQCVFANKNILEV